MSNKYNIYLPLYLVFIYCVGTFGPTTNTRICRMIKTHARNIYLIKEDMERHGAIISTRKGRQNFMELTEKGKKIYNALLVMMTELNISSDLKNVKLTVKKK